VLLYHNPDIKASVKKIVVPKSVAAKKAAAEVGGAQGVAANTIPGVRVVPGPAEITVTMKDGTSTVYNMKQLLEQHQASVSVAGSSPSSSASGTTPILLPDQAVFAAITGNSTLVREAPKPEKSATKRVASSGAKGAKKPVAEGGGGGGAKGSSGGSSAAAAAPPPPKAK
jgi:hypothetical protein